MPSLSRRREEDVRSGRLESVIRSPERTIAVDKVNTRKGLNFCNRCKLAFEEEGKYCPRCDRKDETGHIKAVPVEYREQWHTKELRKAKARLGL